MKKNIIDLIFGLTFTGIGLIVFYLTVGTGIINIPEGNQTIIFIMLFILYTLGLLFLGKYLLAKNKPSYKFEDLKEGQIFKIIFIFEIDNSFSGKMLVVIQGFGEALINLSPKPEDWPQKKLPMKGKTYMKKGNSPIEICL